MRLWSRLQRPGGISPAALRHVKARRHAALRLGTPCAWPAPRTAQDHEKILQVFMVLACAADSARRELRRAAAPRGGAQRACVSPEGLEEAHVLLRLLHAPVACICAPPKGPDRLENSRASHPAPPSHTLYPTLPSSRSPSPLPRSSLPPGCLASSLLPGVEQAPSRLPGKPGVEQGDAVGGEDQVDVRAQRRREGLPAAPHDARHLHLVPWLPGPAAPPSAHSSHAHGTQTRRHARHTQT